MNLPVAISYRTQLFQNSQGPASPEPALVDIDTTKLHTGALQVQ